jgi:hypothetical protein
VEPDRIRTAADVALDFFSRRTDVAFFCIAARVRFPLITLSVMSSLRPLSALNPSSMLKKSAGATDRSAGNARTGWFLLFIWFVWLDETNQMNQINPHPSRPSRPASCGSVIQSYHQRTLPSLQASVCGSYLQLITMASGSPCRNPSIGRTSPDDTSSAD